MSVVDHEKGGDIINPFIAIKGYSKKKSLGKVYLNTSTFSYTQEDIVHPLEWMRKGGDERFDLWYSVHAVVGEYNGNPDLGQVGSSFLHSVSVVRPPRAEVLLGYLERRIVEEKFPNTKEFFDNQREKSED